MRQRLRLGPDDFVEVSPALSAAIAPVFGAMTLALASESNSSNPALLLTVDTKMGLPRLCANGTPIVRAGATDQLTPLLEGALSGFAVRSRTDAAPLHGAAVAIDGRAVLMLGPKGSGKSTLAIALAENGATYLGDEIAFVDYHTAELRPFPKSATLKHGVFHLFPESPTFEDPVRGPVRYRRPARVGTLDERYPIAQILFVQYSPRTIDAWTTQRLTPIETAFELVPQLFGGLERDPRTLPLIARLSALPAFRLELSSSEAGVGAVHLLLEGEG